MPGGLSPGRGACAPIRRRRGREHGAEAEEEEEEEQRVRLPILEEFGHKRKDLASSLFSCFFFLFNVINRGNK